MKIEQVIISQPFNRHMYSFVSNGLVQHSGSLYNNNKGDLNAEEYLQINAHKYNNPTVVTYEEFNEMYYQATQQMKSNFKEVTEDQYYEALECLPPMKWRNISETLNVFFISEMLTADLSACYIKDRANNKYYSATRSIFETDEQLVDIFNQSF